ncbi:hypothetical protein HK097_007649 [Rhizophlyctis rosea]|uniref:DNA-directed RNA polymerase III subunit n=1 Tax=Rhizophlyctis rosea TaxID=64517 RepID=A0AAD5SBD3_9FUNG|nr:hypothetical protein HK097_007649 [Rhizophlyctis rosea]
MSRGGRGGWRGGRGRGNQRGPELPDDVVIKFREEPLFPTYEPEAYREPLPDEDELLKISKQYLDKVQSLPYYIELPEPKRDVERYSDRFKNKRAERRKLKSLTKIPANLAFFPEELHSVKDPSKRVAAKKVKKDVDFNRLAALEKAEANGEIGAPQQAEEDEDAEGEREEDYDEYDDDEENDYGEDHWDEDKDAIGDDDDRENDYS